MNLFNNTIFIYENALCAAAYWRKLKQRLLEEGNETVTNCHELKFQAADGKMRETDVADCLYSRAVFP